MSEITFENVTKRYGSVTAVNGLSLTIRDREFFVIVGPSGCGKSTILRMVAGLESISEGRILLGEREINRLPPGERDVSMVFQSYALFPHLSVFDNMAFGLKIRRVPRDERRRLVDEAARILGLEDYLDRRPRELSGGQKQRVALGRAVVRHPTAFLFDEPLSNLDAKLRTDMRVELKRLHHRLNTTALYVTHDQVEAMTLADRICVLRDGVVQQIGSPEEVYERPINTFVAGFFGSPGINLIAGRIERTGGALQFQPDYGPALPLPSASCADASPNHGVGQPCTLGIRPGRMQIDPIEQGVAFEGETAIVEHIGEDTVVHFDWARQRLAAQVPSNRGIRTGSACKLFAPASALHLFDATGRRLSASFREHGEVGQP